MGIVEDLKEVLDLVRDLRLPDEDRDKQAEILMKIAEKLQPYIPRISEPVSLAWGITCEGEEWNRFTPESNYRISDLSSSEGVILWAPSGPTGDKLWLLSSGKFLYIRTIQYNTGGGIGWSHESWVGAPIESEDPSKLPQVLDEILCDNLMNSALKILATVSEIDELSFQILLNFPQRFVLHFLRFAPCSNAALVRYCEKYDVRGFLVRILGETEDKYTCERVLEVLNRIIDRGSMLELIQYCMYQKSDALRPVFNDWRVKVIKSS